MQVFHYRKFFVAVKFAVLLVLLSFRGFAQTAEIPYHMEPYSLYSGVHSGEKNANEQAVLAFSGIVEVRNASWLRLYFSDANLGLGSYIVMTSLKDNAMQRLNARTLEQWQYSGAYFNGDAVKIELYVARVDKGVFIQIDEVMAGEWGSGPAIESQCGPTDDRVPSNDPRAGRLLNIGCTGWIITNGLFVTAGHCLGGANVMEFNVPLSLPNGTIQHPGPEDQYAVDPATVTGTNGGIGNDWGTFEVFVNAVTGLHPIAAQGDAYTVVQNLLPNSIRISGYGVDNGTANQIQQTHVGPNAGSSGTTMRYVTDTEGGNSGSPVIDEATNTAVGVHTHGGCTTAGTGNNNGTSCFHPDFWAALSVPGVLAPAAPEGLAAYSDYTTPTSMLLSWTDPSHLINGDTLLAGQFKIHIERDSVAVDSVDGGVGSFPDQGLNDGQEYVYDIYAKLDTTLLTSPSIQTSWIAGGSPVPNPPTDFSVAGGENQVELFWVNPNTNIDGTPMDDFEAIYLYQNGAPAATFTRSSADTGSVDSALFTPATPGFYEYYLVAVDNESSANKSEPTVILGTPLSIPVADEFAEAGEPNPGLWVNTDADVNERADTPPSPPYALNLNGKPNGGDIVDLKPIDLSGMQGSNIQFSYFYQPQGNGNIPEPGDSLRVYFKNDLDQWVLVKGYDGMSNQPFAEELIDIESAPNGGGSYFHGQFQVRFRSSGGAGTFPNDDWFIDNITLSTPVSIAESAEAPYEFTVRQNYPNPFNPSTTIEYQLPERSEVSLVVYNTLGQKIRTLLNHTVEAGFQRVTWDGRDDKGQTVSSGIYIYHFAAGDYKTVQRMVLLK
jgi:V8-like Glu-specific endopeptidase